MDDTTFTRVRQAANKKLPVRGFLLWVVLRGQPRDISFFRWVALRCLPGTSDSLVAARVRTIVDKVVARYLDCAVPESGFD
jgi:hypothetical protein